jgi:hypothetical protein
MPRIATSRQKRPDMHARTNYRPKNFATSDFAQCLEGLLLRYLARMRNL